MHWLRRHDRGRPPHPDVLTPAEWRVLEHLREGLTNGEIASRLDVSVNTVRTHVSSMLAKTGLPDREALARWPGAPAAASRLALARGRGAGLLAPLAWLRAHARAAGIAGAASLGLAALVLVAAAIPRALDGGGDGAVPPVVSTARPTSTALAAATEPPATPEPPTDVTPKPTPTGVDPSPLLMPFSGVSEPGARPRSTPTSSVSLAPPSPSPFQPYDRESREVVLYDIETMTERRLGEGGFTRFSPDGTKLAWIGFTNPPSVMEGELHVLDLESNEEEVIGPARGFRWLDEDRVVAFVRGNDMAVIDIVTGDYSDAGPLNLNSPPAREREGNLRLDDVTEEILAGPPWRYEYRVTFLDGSAPPIEFEAYRARLSPDGMIVFAVPPPDADTNVAWGTPVEGDIYLADPRTVEAEYVATALMSYGNWPLDVSERQVFWTDDYCNFSDGRSRFYDRETGELVEVDERLWGEFTPDGNLAVGTFGAERILDTEAFDYVVSLPFDFADVFWSPDYRYAAVGAAYGHGGLCGG